jgi:hypothetical protein
MELHFVMSENYAFRVAASHDAWNLEPNGSYPVEWRLDKGPWQAARAVTIDGRAFGIDLPSTEAVFSAFRHAHLLVIQGTGDPMLFDLSNTLVGLSALRDCVDRWATPSTQPNPFQNAPKPFDSSAPTPSSGGLPARADLVAFAANLLITTGIRFQFLGAEELGFPPRDDAVAFSTDSYLGIVGAMPAGALPRAYLGGVISTFAEGCSGDAFQALREDKATGSVSGRLACSPTNGDATLTGEFFTIPTDSAVFSVSILGLPPRTGAAPPKAEDISRAANLLREAAFRE